MDTRLTPVVKWPGGKTRLASVLAEYYARYRDLLWVEPFSGALGAVLGVMPERALCNDLNPDIQNLHLHIRHGMKPNPYTFTNEEQAYYKFREEFNALVRAGRRESCAAAWLFYYLSKHGYNGLVRYNKAHEWNVPFGQYKTVNLRTEFACYQKVFARWQFSCCDFTQAQVVEDAFYYADSPYDCEFVNYTGDGFSWSDQERLAVWLAKRSGPVIASNAATPRILELYQDLGFLCHWVESARRISCKGAQRDPVVEMLALSKDLA